MLKTRKWYSSRVIPDRSTELVVMTDMGYVFEAVYENNKFSISTVVNGKVYFKETDQESLIKWMKY